MQKINFQNLPNTTTPINATNLNAIQTNVEDVFNGNEAMGDIKATSIEISRGSGSQSRVRTIRTDTGADMEFGIGYAGTNRGIYDNTTSKWILVTDGSTNTMNGNTTINGNITASNFNDSGWTDISIDTTKIDNFAWEPLAYRKIGNIVYIHGGASALQNLTNQTQIGSGLPKPRQNTAIIAAENNSRNTFNFVVDYDGLFKVSGDVYSGNQFIISASYITRE